MDFNYTKIKIGNWLFNYCFPLYNFAYSRFKRKNDAFEIAILKNELQVGDHVLDIGANIGFYSKILSGITGSNGKVYCFEPDRVNFKHLESNTASLTNVLLFNNAVSDKKDILKVYKSKLLNVDHRTYPVNNYDSIEEINAISIDDLITDKIITKVDFIKIDIQGYELFAFKGMLNLLRTSNHLKIVTEFWPHGFRKAGNSAIEFYDFFAGMDYHFSLIETDKIVPLNREYVVKNNDKPFEFSFNVLIVKN